MKTNQWKSKIGGASLLKRMLILAILMGGLAVLMSDRSVVKVRADDCTSVRMDLSSCYTNCGSVYDYSDRISCYSDCEFTHQMAGATCEDPTHTPMMAPGGCDPSANGQRAYDNCIAGTLEGFWLGEYLNYLAYYNDMEVACLMVQQSVENQGCY